MRLVHLSDLHLGFRQYQRLTPGGANQREVDVARTFERTIEQVIARRPDVVLIAGDVFHAVRPSNPAILHAFRQFTKLRYALPEALLVMVAGNHDAPKTTETGCILRLFSELRIHVVDATAERLHFPERDLSILAVPDAPSATRPVFAPDPAARWNLLLVHGEVEGILPKEAVPTDRAAIEITREELRAPEWSYVALGHYHVYRAVAPNAYYSGSIDYTSANAWGEVHEERAAGIAGKGFIERDLATGEHTFHAIEPSRPLLELPEIVARGMSSAELDAAIRATVEQAPGGIDEKIVRLVVRDVPRHIARELDHRALREFKRRALHFHLLTYKPDVQRHDVGGSPGRRPSLPDIVREKLRTRLLPSDVDREALVALGLRYLEEADALVTVEPALVAAGEDAE